MSDIVATITHPDDTTEELDIVLLDVEDVYREERVATAYALRDDVNALSQLNLGDDKISVEVDGTEEFGGALVDDEIGGGVNRLRLESYEYFGRRTKPTDGGERWLNADDTDIVNDAIAEVDEWSAGTIENVGSNLDFVFSHVSQAKKLRTVAEATGAEVKFHDDGTVDYVSSLGADKTSTVIGVAEGNVEGEPTIDIEGGQRYTHLRVVGAGEGPAQLSVDIEASDYETSDPENWETYANKDLKRESALEAWGEALIEELNEESIRYAGDVRGVDIERGDEFTVDHPPDNFNEALRATSVEHVFSNEGTIVKTEFSNRAIGDVEKNRLVEDADKYNLAFEGNGVWATPGGSRQPVDDDLNYEMSFYYPDEVEYEHRVKLQVKGLAYRSYVSALGHNHSVTFPDHTHSFSIPNHNHNVSISDTSTANSYEESFSVDSSFEEQTTAPEGLTISPGSGNDVWGFVRVRPSGTFDNPVNVSISLRDGSSVSDSSLVSQTFSISDDESREVAAGVAVRGEDRSSNSVTLRIGATDASNNNMTINDVAMSLVAPPEHDHDVSDSTTSSSGGSHSDTTADGGGTTETTDDEAGFEPGINQWDGVDESPEHYPENCDVLVNGSSVGVSLGDGDGEFEQTVDLAGELTQGAWNTIEITSDSLGHVQAIMDIDVYRQILGDG